MANFEGLIRSALETQDASSNDVRQVIYQSSRNALQNIIDNNRSLTLEAVMDQKRKLEASIASIEAEYNPPQPSVIEAPVEREPQIETYVQPIVVGTKPEELTTPPSSINVETESQTVSTAELPPQVAQDDPLHEIQQILASTSPQVEQPQPVQPQPVQPKPAQAQAAPVAPEPAPAPIPNIQPPEPPQSQQVQPEVQRQPEPVVQQQTEVNIDAQQAPHSPQYYEEEENLPIGFSKRRKTQKRFLWTLVILVILGLLAWIIYIATHHVMDSSLLSQDDNGGNKLNPNSISLQEDADNYITVINANDLSSLSTSGSGKAQIVNQLNSNMIRINSVRDPLNRSEPASPMLIRLAPGVLKQISGKRVTVEIYAKAGGGDTAHFAVGCEFGNLSECGRKRFLAGSQPNASVFAFQMDQVSDINQDMFLTLSTDTTSEAAVTGTGDVLDIVYIRLSVDN